MLHIHKSADINHVLTMMFGRQGWDQNNVFEYLIEMSTVTRLYVLAVGSITTNTVDSSYLGKFWRGSLTCTRHRL